MKDKYKLIERIPTVDEYLTLRTSVGWAGFDFESCRKGLSSSIYSVCAVQDNKVIGCGRLIGDGGIYFYIHDIIVLPEFHRKGVGSSIIEAILDYIDSHASPDAYVGLMAAIGASDFYKKYDFIERPADRPGMFRAIKNGK